MLKIQINITELIMASLDLEQRSLNTNEIILFFYQNKNQQILKGTGLSPQDTQSWATADTAQARTSDLGTFSSAEVLCESLALE